MTLHRHARFNRLEGCMFGFYSEDEILKLSTCEIKELKGLSVLSLGEPNGLHDPRMGTLSDKQQEVCPTCNSTHRYCPGHIGHIRLSVPIYNPTIFKFIDAILTRKCYNCHHLLFNQHIIDIIKHKLKTIENGYVFDINAIQQQLLLLQEADDQKVTKQIFDDNSKKTKIREMSKKRKNRHKSKKKSKKNRSNDKQENDDSDSDDEHGIDILSDMSSSSSNDEVDEQQPKQENAASSKPINMDFLDEGIMKGTRQSVLKLRWKLFELRHISLSKSRYVLCI